MSEMLEVAVFWPGENEPSQAEIQEVFHQVGDLHEKMRLIKAEFHRTGDKEAGQRAVIQAATGVSKTAQIIYARVLRQVLEAGINPDDISMHQVLGVELRKGPEDEEYIKEVPLTEH